MRITGAIICKRSYRCRAKDEVFFHGGVGKENDGRNHVVCQFNLRHFNFRHFDDVVLHSHADIIKAAQNFMYFDDFLHSHADISDTARHSWHGTAHSSFDAFLHSHADISDTARHSWHGTAHSSSVNIH